MRTVEAAGGATRLDSQNPDCWHIELEHQRAIVGAPLIIIIIDRASSTGLGTPLLDNVAE